jgi:glucose/mannose-6-phosphate isomerase
MTTSLWGPFVYNELMLDDQSFISRLDNGNALGVVGGQPGQLAQQFMIPDVDGHGLANIVLAGMGGSALAGLFLQRWLRHELKLPLAVERTYDLPAYIDEDSLVIISSYSGNTEEAIAALEEARRANARIVIMTAGGELAKRAESSRLPLIQIPGGYQPRLAVLYGIKALASLFDHIGFTNDAAGRLVEASHWLGAHLASWAAQTPTHENLAKRIAKDLLGCSVVVYAGPILGMQAFKWKIDINENAKHAAFFYEMSEFNHNEFLGWKHPRDKLLKVVQLHSKLDHPQIQKRWDVSNRLLSGQMPKPIIVTAEGESPLEQMLWSQLLGDYVSLYLAFLDGVDPTPVDLIEKLKKELK